MKYLLLFLFSTSLYAQSAKVGMISKTVTSAGTPLVLSSADILVRKVWFAYSASNTGSIGYVGNSAANAVAATGIPIVKATATIAAPILTIEPPIGGPKLNLADIWVDVATSGDEINAFYIE